MNNGSELFSSFTLLNSYHPALDAAKLICIQVATFIKNVVAMVNNKPAAKSHNSLNSSLGGLPNLLR